MKILEKGERKEIGLYYKDIFHLFLNIIYWLTNKSAQNVWSKVDKKPSGYPVIHYGYSLISINWYHLSIFKKL